MTTKVLLTHEQRLALMECVCDAAVAHDDALELGRLAKTKADAARASAVHRLADELLDCTVILYRALCKEPTQ